MGDLKNPRVIIVKGFLFLFTGIVALAGILAENFDFQTAFLLFVAIWSFCRFYYFAFYVLEHYVDEEFKFAGLWDFAMYFWKRRKASSTK